MGGPGIHVALQEHTVQVRVNVKLMPGCINTFTAGIVKGERKVRGKRSRQRRRACGQAKNGY